jgi:hypothetical protein
MGKPIVKVKPKYIENIFYADVHFDVGHDASGALIDQLVGVWGQGHVLSICFTDAANDGSNAYSFSPLQLSKSGNFIEKQAVKKVFKSNGHPLVAYEFEVVHQVEAKSVEHVGVVSKVDFHEGVWNHAEYFPGFDFPIRVSKGSDAESVGDGAA